MMKPHFAYVSRVHLWMKLLIDGVHSLGRQKVFCVGYNKTGTTSMAKVLRDLGLIVGVQRLGELLLHDWARRDFRRLFLYCRTAQAFQDVPFSLPFTFQALDQRFPRSKFILTMRDSPEQWYDSLMHFYAAKFGNRHVPTSDDLKSAEYVYKGFMYESNRLIRTTAENDLFNKELLIADYNAHNNAILQYFRHRPKDLLVLNVAEPDAYNKLCRFLGKPCTDKEFPWENKTANVGKRPAAQ